MGKGDKKTKRGKIIKGTYGANRPRKEKNAEAAPKNPSEGKKKTK
jgi:30S ribosomal protein S31